MGKEQLWSMSTTIREAERIIGFLSTAQEMEGEEWTRANQEKFQILLIKNRQYLNDPDNTQIYHNMNDEQKKILSSKEIEMTFEQASDIFYSKNYNDPPMRGRQSMSPLVKLGLVFIVKEKTMKDGKEIEKRTISVSSVGKKLLNNEISFDEFMLDCLLKYQYPNPLESSYKDWDTKPFINVLRLIKRVNELCEEQNIAPKGISKTEFGVFALSLKTYSNVDKVAKDILQFRNELSLIPENEQDEFIETYIKDYLKDFNNPVKNTKEYTDNMIRYVRLTKYIYIRGKYNHTYIDLEPRRMKEINSILAVDNGHSLIFDEKQWIDYMGTYNSYEKPFETQEKLTEILFEIKIEVEQLENELSLPHKTITIPDNIDKLKGVIEEIRLYRTDLQNLAIKKEYHQHTDKIDEAVKALNDILRHNKASLAKKYSIELEKWANVALNILNDAVSIRPNAPVGDDNEPIYTAPSGVADIECQYEDFVSICEVTTLTNRDQWFNEGQPVMRHLRGYENLHADKQGYCLFIAPSLHVDTINTFYMSVKYEYESKPQKIVPITITQLILILQATKAYIEKGKKLSHRELKRFYDLCVCLDGIAGSVEWKNHINSVVQAWATELEAC